ncbi:SDR family oxidoreductase [Streptomyces hokutonensis]|uniref:SDR family oxidoreductase n=1 Tax=Streptomyces hokutonensis TaxID=1306990 RepID=UPI0033DD93CC
MNQQTVVITGAGAGIGRATARLFAERGANVVLLARGEAGLDAAVADVEDRGGRALAVPTDMADPAQIEPDEYKRVTEVSYLGFVNGTRAALRRMIPRDTGVIVQVGSALGDRSIPLQSAYCGAKHAVNGFTSSVRTELMHRHSHVHITVVQMPAVNTPQFSWVLSRLPKHPQPVPPIYQPEVAARAVVNAADHPHRKQYYVGASTAATILANKLAPALLDRYLARTGYASQQTDAGGPGVREPNLWHPADEAPEHDYGAHGTFDERSHSRSAQAALARHPGLVLAGATGAVAMGPGAVIRRRGPR